MTYIAKKYSQLQIRSSEESTTGHIVKMLKGKEKPPRERWVITAKRTWERWRLTSSSHPRPRAGDTATLPKVESIERESRQILPVKDEGKPEHSQLLKRCLLTWPMEILSHITLACASPLLILEAK